MTSRRSTRTSTCHTKYRGLGTSKTLPATTAEAGWHVSGRVLESTTDTLKVGIVWQRVWDHGALLPHPATGMSTLTLQRGEPVALDSIVPEAQPAACTSQAIQLTASAQPAVQPRGGARGVNSGATTSVARAGGSGGPITGVFSGSGGAGARGGRGAGAVGGGSSVAGPRAGGGGGGRSGSAFEAAAPGSVAGVDLWLLDQTRAANGSGSFSLNQRYRMISLAAAGSSFEFDPLIVATPHGDVTVRIFGRLIPVVTNGKVASVDVQITRAVKGDGPPAIDVTGGATHTLSPIDPADVVAFELPSGERDDPGLLGDHHLSLRVRVR